MKIYVGNLSFNTSEDMLKNKFEEFGSVNSVNIVKDRDTGRSRGFAFVEMNDKTTADAAIASLNGVEYEGRSLVVNEARSRDDRAPRTDRFNSRSNNGGGGNGGRRDRW